MPNKARSSRSLLQETSHTSCSICTPLLWHCSPTAYLSGIHGLCLTRFILIVMHARRRQCCIISVLSAAIVAFAPAYAQNKSCEPVTYPRTGELPKAVKPCTACCARLAPMITFRIKDFSGTYRSTLWLLALLWCADSAIGPDDVAGQLHQQDQLSALAWLQGRRRQGSLFCLVVFLALYRVHPCLGDACVALQYVFAITESAHSGTGGEIWRSDSYGAYNSWQNLTDSLPGTMYPLP